MIWRVFPAFIPVKNNFSWKNDCVVYVSLRTFDKLLIIAVSDHVYYVAKLL